MFDLGFAEILVILIVGLLVIGPDKLPEVARGVARVVRQVRRMVNDVRDSINLEELAAEEPARPPRPSAPAGSQVSAHQRTTEGFDLEAETGAAEADAPPREPPATRSPDPTPHA